MYRSEDYRKRAKKCLELADRAKDELIERELLSLKRTYIAVAERLMKLERARLN